MKLILKTDNKNSIARSMALASELNVAAEQRGKIAEDKNNNGEFKKWLLNFKASGPSSFGNAAEWERNEREDRDLPFSELII